MLFPLSSDMAVVAELAIPWRLPTNVLAVIELRPVTSNTVPPKFTFVLPKVMLLFCNLSFPILQKSLELVTLPSLRVAETVHPLVSAPPTP